MKQVGQILTESHEETPFFFFGRYFLPVEVIKNKLSSETDTFSFDLSSFEDELTNILFNNRMAGLVVYISSKRDLSLFLNTIAKFPNKIDGKEKFCIAIVGSSLGKALEKGTKGSNIDVISSTSDAYQLRVAITRRLDNAQGQALIPPLSLGKAGTGRVVTYGNQDEIKKGKTIYILKGEKEEHGHTHVKGEEEEKRQIEIIGREVKKEGDAQTHLEGNEDNRPSHTHLKGGNESPIEEEKKSEPPKFESVGRKTTSKDILVNVSSESAGRVHVVGSNTKEKQQRMASMENKYFTPIDSKEQIMGIILECIEENVPASLWSKQLNTQTQILFTGFDEERLIATPKNKNHFMEMVKSWEKNPVSDLFINANLRRARVFFLSEDLVVLNDLSMRVKVPQSVYEVQRRYQFRLPIYPFHAEYITAKTENGDLISLRIFDLSSGGMGLIVPPEQSVIPKKGEIFHDFRFKIMNREVVIPKCEVRHITPDYKDGQKMFNRLGIRFVDISPNSASLINLFVIRESMDYLNKFL